MLVGEGLKLYGQFVESLEVALKHLLVVNAVLFASKSELLVDWASKVSEFSDGLFLFEHEVFTETR